MVMNAENLVQEVEESKRTQGALSRLAEELARSNTELEQFAYVASHDLREPLRMVISYLKLLERRYRGKLDAEAEEFIEYAVDGADRMRVLINDLLQYSRLGALEKPVESVDCSLVVKSVADNLKVMIDESGAVLTRDPLPQVMGDPVQLAELFQNLLSNAIKFRSHRPPKIHIETEQKNGECVFSVRDNGIGMDPLSANRVFIIFQRLHTQSEYPGTGVGLAVCKKIVERHGGRIWVESKPGKGSTFFFTIPAKGGSEL